MILTDAKLTKAKNISVFLDDEYSFSLPPIIWEQEKLKIGMEITPERASELLYKGSYDMAKSKALYLLGMKAYTKKKLLEKLSQKFDPEIALRAVERMEELNLIDDEAYCRDYVEYLFKEKGYGKRKIVSCLKEKGIGEFIIEDVLSDFDISDDFERAKEKALKRKHENTPKEKNRIYNFLLRQGYSYETIKEVLEDIFSEEDQGYEL